MNNEFNISGILRDVKVDHEQQNGVVIYSGVVDSKIRGKEYHIPVRFQENVKEIYKLKEGLKVNLTGELRTQKKKEDKHLSLVPYFYVMQSRPHKTDYNYGRLMGKVCKRFPVIKRKDHNICSLIVAVQRHNSEQYDYIPVVGHNLTANLFSTLSIGSTIVVSGAFKQRKYHEKKTGDTKYTYEVNVDKFSIKL